MKKILSSLLSEELPNFIATEDYHKHTTGIIYTDGIKFLVEIANAYWLLDIVSSYQSHKLVKGLPFQVYTLVIYTDNSAELSISDGNDNIVTTQIIEYTDFPMPRISLWCVNKVLMLPSEY